jgi:hypothetical protein
MSRENVELVRRLCAAWKLPPCASVHCVVRDGPYWFSSARRAGSVACCVGIASVTTHSRPAWATEPLVRLRSRSGSAPRRVAARAREPALFDGDAQLLVRAVVLGDGVHLTLHEVVQTVERAL